MEATRPGRRTGSRAQSSAFPEAPDGEPAAAARWGRIWGRGRAGDWGWGRIGGWGRIWGWGRIGGWGRIWGWGRIGG